MRGEGAVPWLRRRILEASGIPRRILPVSRRALGWLDRPYRRWVAAAVLLALVGAVGLVASSGFGSATAGQAQLAGRPVPAGEARIIAAAALSCPALTPAKLAGQLMAGSGFDANAKSSTGGVGLAGLTDADWDKWKPQSDAQRNDRAANINALAHLTCDLVGQVRQAGIGGDPWRLALGAYLSGIEAVRKAKDVPGPARGYVQTVVAHAAWYANEGGGGASPSVTPAPIGVVPSRGTAPKPVPDDYRQAVLAAGQLCPAVSPARIAAQLMASSGFDPNLLGAHGGQGIAQFTPETWARYTPFAASASPWDPSAAIPALGRTMCMLVGEMSGLSKDPYQAALVAFRLGPEAVRQAGGLPDALDLRDYSGMVSAYESYYGSDPRLGGKPAATANRPSSGTATTATAPPPTSLTTAAPPASRPQPSRPAANPPKPNWQTRTVVSTAVLRPGQAWTTNRLNFVLAKDGNILLYDQGRLVWQANSGGQGGAQLVFQADGNLVLYSVNNATVWSSNTPGNNGAILVLQADGNVTISSQGRTLWQTGTAS
jgi:hypothetical protein